MPFVSRKQVTLVTGAERGICCEIRPGLASNGFAFVGHYSGSERGNRKSVSQVGRRAHTCSPAAQPAPQRH